MLVRNVSKFMSKGVNHVMAESRFHDPHISGPNSNSIPRYAMLPYYFMMRIYLGSGKTELDH